MCIVVQAVSSSAAVAPWDPGTLTIRVPSTVSRSAAWFIIGETLRTLGIPQPLDRPPTCFCGEPVDISATIPHQARVNAQMSRRTRTT